MKRNQPNEYEKPWLLLCEGDCDRRFFQALIQKHGIEDKFHVEFPAKDEDDSGGRDKFGKRLLTLQEGTSESFRENIKAVLVVSDNDDNPAESFTAVKNQLKLAKFPVPQEERVVARKNNYPATVVLMIPCGTPGNLETLCAEAAHQKFGLKNEVDNLLAAAPASGWGVSKQSKMRVHAMIASTCRKAPDISFANHFGMPEEFRFPLDHLCFDEIALFLIGFGEMLKANPA